MKKFFLIPIQIYKICFSPFLGNNCRYTPSCSSYMKQAIERHGVLKGITLGIMRIFRCHPYSAQDMCDPVPERFAWKDMISYKKRSNHKNT